MKGFVAFALLGLFALAQGRSTDLQSVTRSVAELGENPWVVHLRLAVDTSGLLNSCVGSLIHDRWVLTSASCVRGARFIWIRYGAVTVINPSLVTETSLVRPHPSYDPTTGENDIALISINRPIESTDTIAPVRIGSEEDSPSSVKFCGYGATKSGSAGEFLSCTDTEVVDGKLQAYATQFDLGAPLVNDGVQVGILVNEETGAILNPGKYRDWIESTASIDLDNAGEEPEVAPEEILIAH